MNFQLTVLGSNSSIPAVNRNPSAYLLSIRNRYCLIDCGEGTQSQLRRYGIKMQRIEQIYISHMHGDHYFGLVGLLSTMNLLGREKALTIFAPPELRAIVAVQLEAGDNKLRFPIEWHQLPFENGVEIFSDNHFTVRTLKLDHRVPTCGFVFREQPLPRKMDKTAIEEHAIPIAQIRAIKEGADFVAPDGTVIPNAEITSAAPAQRSFAYCCDTAYNESILPHIHKVNLLLHEATFLEDMQERARKTHHCTAKQAATIAQKAEVGSLLMSHFSARYKETDAFEAEAQLVFKPSMAAVEGRSYAVPQSLS